MINQGFIWLWILLIFLFFVDLFYWKSRFLFFLFCFSNQFQNLQNHIDFSPLHNTTILIYTSFICFSLKTHNLLLYPCCFKNIEKTAKISRLILHVHFLFFQLFYSLFLDLWISVQDGWGIWLTSISPLDSSSLLSMLVLLKTIFFVFFKHGRYALQITSIRSIATPRVTEENGKMLMLFVSAKDKLTMKCCLILNPRPSKYSLPLYLHDGIDSDLWNRFLRYNLCHFWEWNSHYYQWSQEYISQSVSLHFACRYQIHYPLTEDVVRINFFSCSYQRLFEEEEWIQQRVFWQTLCFPKKVLQRRIQVLSLLLIH